MIVAARVDAFTSPSQEAAVAQQLRRGARVCVLDEASYDGILFQRPGWLAIRIPSGVGYVAAQAVELTAPASASCSTPPSNPPPSNPPPSNPPPSTTGVSDTPVSRSGSAAASSHEIAATADVPDAPSSEQIAGGALLRGGFVPLRPVRYLLSVGSGRVSLNERATSEHALKGSGFTIHGTLGLSIYDIFMVSGTLGAAFPHDDGAFTQIVVPEEGPGDPRAADSALALTTYTVAAGLRTPFWALATRARSWVTAALFTQVGAAGIHGKRSIANCVDCRDDELELPGGTFWRVGADISSLAFKAGNAYGLTVAYQRYASAGFADEIQIGFSCWLQ